VEQGETAGAAAAAHAPRGERPPPTNASSELVDTTLLVEARRDARDFLFQNEKRGFGIEIGSEAKHTESVNSFAIHKY
jgi:hypothetical protein